MVLGHDPAESTSSVFGSDPSRMEDLYPHEPETIMKALTLARRIKAFLAGFAPRGT